MPGSTRLPELTSMQRTLLCEYLVDVFPPRTVMCGDLTLNFGFSSPSQCVGALPTTTTCTATVDQTEACFEELGSLTDDEVCNLQSLPASCSVIFGESCQPE